MRGGMTLSFPPFTRAVKKLIIANTAIFLLMILLPMIGVAVAPQLASAFLYLRPTAVVHGQIWQLITYAFFHAGFFHLFFNMLTLWMFGSQFEMDWGTRRFTEFFFWCVAGAALTTVVLGYAGLFLYHAAPLPLFRLLAGLTFTGTIGASGGIYGLLIAFGMLYGDREIFMFPLPFLIKARYMVFIWIFIALIGALGDTGGVANFAHLGGALFGWIYLRALPKKGLGFAASEGLYGIRNRYYRWKRKQAQKKFEVYMGKHRREEFFDEYGNYKAPGNEKRDDDSRGPWVN